MFLRSDVGGLQLVVHLPVAARLLLPVGFLRLLEQQVAVFMLLGRCSSGGGSKSHSGGGSRLLRVDGGAAGFGDGGVVVFSPAGFNPGVLPLSPLPLQRCPGLDVNRENQVRI